MAHLGLRRLIGAALMDRELYDGLMNGQRSALVAQFELTEEECQVLASFDAGSARELASTVHHWLKERGNPTPASANCSVVQIA